MPTPQENLTAAAKACEGVATIMKIESEGALRPMKDDLAKYQIALKSFEDARDQLMKFSTLTAGQKPSIEGALHSLEARTKNLNGILSNLVKNAQSYSAPPLKGQYDKVTKDLHGAIKLVEANHQVWQRHLTMISPVKQFKG